MVNKNIKIQKKKRKVLTQSRPSDKRWMRAVGGYSSFRYISLFVIGLGLIGVSFAVLQLTKTENVVFKPLPSIAHTSEVPDTGEILQRLNTERKTNNRTELVSNDELKKVAEQRLREMINSQQYAHKNLAGKYYYDLMAERGYKADYSCENLDIEPSNEPIQFIKSWMSSGAGHKDCMLSDKVSQAGIASGKFNKTDDEQDAFLAVVIFASKPTEKSAQNQ